MSGKEISQLSVTVAPPKQIQIDLLYLSNAEKRLKRIIFICKVFGPTAV